MEDYSYLDKKYFIDESTYNCPFCNRNNVPFIIDKSFKFHWTENKVCIGFIVICSSCEKQSMHLTYANIIGFNTIKGGYYMNLKNLEVDDVDIDSLIFHSQPTSFFALDKRIPRRIREAITEAEGCLKMNFLTGASACTRKAIYELLVEEKVEGERYNERIKNLKDKYKSSVDESYFEALEKIKGMTSEKVHEQSWPKWNSPNLKFLMETLKNILYEIYVLPEEKAERLKKVRELHSKIKDDKKALDESPDTQLKTDNE